MTSPTHEEARQAVPVPLGRPGSATVVLKKKEDEGEWAGTYLHDDKVSTMTLSGSGTSLTGTQDWKNGDRHGHNTITSCQVTGQTAKCDWRGTYEGDPDKSGERHGTVEMTLSGKTVSGRYNEDEPNFHWNVPAYPSAMHKGAVWPFTCTKK